MPDANTLTPSSFGTLPVIRFYNEATSEDVTWVCATAAIAKRRASELAEKSHIINVVIENAFAYTD